MARVPVVKFKPVYGVPARDITEVYAERRAQGLDERKPVGRPRLYGARTIIQLHLEPGLLERMERVLPRGSRTAFIAQAIVEALDRMPKPVDPAILLAKRLAEIAERKSKPQEPRVNRKKY